MRVVELAVAMISGGLNRLGFDKLRINGDDWRLLLVLVSVCLACAVLVVDFARAPGDSLQPGDVAPRTVKAPFEFAYADHGAHERAREQASEAAPPVFVHRLDLFSERRQRIATAFAAGRQRLKQLTGAEGPPPPLGQELQLLVSQAFLDPLRVELPENDVVILAKGGFSPEAEALSEQLLDTAMRDRLVVLNRDAFPPDRRPLVLIEVGEGERSERQVTDPSTVVLPEQARQQVSLGMLASDVEANAETNAAAAVARALVTANMTFDPLQTAERRETAAAAVALAVERVKRGQILFRAGDTLTGDHIEVYAALQEHQGDQDLLLELFAISLFLCLLFMSLYHFGSSYLPGFSTRVRDVTAVGALVVLTGLLARVTVASSEGIATLIGFEAEPRSVWFLVPVAGTVMLVRLLLGIPWTVVFTVAVSAVCGLVMELQALPMMFFVISGVAAASAVEHTRERIAVVRAGVMIGVVNAITVLVIHFVQLYVVEGELSMATTMRPVWTMSFAFMGGVLSSFLVLGMIPAFEALGFVTDYRLLELANLNHPLLRQLMLRAPGSYHHSVIVGTLAEAGADKIGANALVAKVASYFHDIGKSLKPQYFVENQQGVSKHSGLDPHTSAHIIISHVTDGGRMAKEHSLPRPIVDNIAMHHGTGILQYFYAAARAQADDPDAVDEGAFRYPGPKPSTREAGVIMLADKVEAATRTLRMPDEHNIRAMISRIVNSVIADGQFSECPLTLQEIHTIADTFVSVLLGIYHQRIEYPETADLSNAPSAGEVEIAAEDEAKKPAKPKHRGGPTPPKHATITLDLAPRPQVAEVPQSSQTTPSPPVQRQDVAIDDDQTPEPAEGATFAGARDEEEDAVDYEAVDFLPRGD